MSNQLQVLRASTTATLPGKPPVFDEGDLVALGNTMTTSVKTKTRTSSSRSKTAKKKTASKSSASKTPTRKAPAKSARASRSKTSGVKVSTKKKVVSKASATASKTSRTTTNRVKTAKKTVKTVTSGKSRSVRAVKKSASKTRARTSDDSMSMMAAAMYDEELKAGGDAALERQVARDERERELIDRLAVSLNRYDEMPNLELAADIVFSFDSEAIGLLLGLLERGDDVYAPDAARVMAEVGIREPDLVEPHLDQMVTLISWDAGETLPFVMAALAPLGHRVVDDIWEYRDLFWSIVNEGQEQADTAQAAAVKLLSAMCAAGPDYARTLAGGLVDLLGKCLPRDVALYAEAVLPALGSSHSHRAKPVLDRRLKELTPAEVARLRRAVQMAASGVPYPAAAA